jgi:hypothetical protein
LSSTVNLALLAPLTLVTLLSLGLWLVRLVRRVCHQLPRGNAHQAKRDSLAGARLRLEAAAAHRASAGREAQAKRLEEEGLLANSRANAALGEAVSF